MNEFNKVATTPLEEWIEYLKTGTIKENTNAPGLQEAKEKLQYLKMSREERQAYDRHIDNIRVQKDILETKVLEGLEQGLERGLKQGRAEGEHKKMMDIAKKMKESGMDISIICEMTGVNEDDLINL